MARNIEKLIKIENGKISEIELDTIEVVFPTLPKLDLTNIEQYTEPEITIPIDLGLDQLEEE